MFSIQKYGGVTKYFCELMKNISEENQFHLSVLFSENHYLKEDSSFFKKHYIPFPEKKFKGKKIIKNLIYNVNKKYSNKAISDSKFDVFHPTFYDDYFLPKLNKPYIITVHDLIEFKEDIFKESERKTQMERVIKNADRIISISENTKSDIINILNINPGKIDVIYHGYNKPNHKNQGNKWGQYILYVGRRGGYKNFKKFAQAVSILFEKDSQIQLICVGEPFTAAELELLKSLNILDKTTALSVDETQLNSLYSNALVFVYPTLYEGFGMPILEAFANNCPICLSNTGPLPEIAGDAGVYFDPYNDESILNAMQRVIYDNEFSKELVQKGTYRLKDFSWEKTARQTVKTYEKVI